MKLGAIIEFQAGADAPHDGEDVQTLEMLRSQLPGLVLVVPVRQKTVQKGDRLGMKA